MHEFKKKSFVIILDIRSKLCFQSVKRDNKLTEFENGDNRKVHIFPQSFRNKTNLLYLIKSTNVFLMWKYLA